MIKKTVALLCVSFVLINCKRDKKQEATEAIQNIVEKTLPTMNFSKLSFNAADGLEISAHEYKITDSKGVIVLCHQANYNKYEYEGIAQRLNVLGYSCVAIDQRSGNTIADTYENNTYNRAKEANKPTAYIDAIPDIEAAIDYVYNKYGMQVLLWGSSYSATLALHIGKTNDKVLGIVSFSPGNYFSKEDNLLVEKIVDGLDKPLFITASKREVSHLKTLLSDFNFSNKQVLFTPENPGNHGSKVLWDGQPNNEEYWIAIAQFLNTTM